MVMEAESTEGGWALMDEPAYRGVKARYKEWEGAVGGLAGVQPTATTDVAMMIRMGRTCAIDTEEEQAARGDEESAETQNVRKAIYQRRVQGGVRLTAVYAAREGGSRLLETAVRGCSVARRRGIVEESTLEERRRGGRERVAGAGLMRVI